MVVFTAYRCRNELIRSCYRINGTRSTCWCILCCIVFSLSISWWSQTVILNSTRSRSANSRNNAIFIFIICIVTHRQTVTTAGSKIIDNVINSYVEHFLNTDIICSWTINSCHNIRSRGRVWYSINHTIMKFTTTIENFETILTIIIGCAIMQDQPLIEILTISICTWPSIINNPLIRTDTKTSDIYIQPFYSSIWNRNRYDTVIICSYNLYSGAFSPVMPMSRCYR